VGASGFGASARVGTGRAAVGTGVIHNRHSRRKQAEMPTVALGHRDALLADRDELSIGLLRTADALRTNRESDLIRGSPFIPLTGPAEDVACHQHQGRVVVERSPAVALEFAHGLSEQAQCFGSDLAARLASVVDAYLKTQRHTPGSGYYVGNGCVLVVFCVDVYYQLLVDVLGQALIAVPTPSIHLPRAVGALELPAPVTLGLEKPALSATTDYLLVDADLFELR
jgi:hypothetical protein